MTRPRKVRAVKAIMHQAGAQSYDAFLSGIKERTLRDTKNPRGVAEYRLLPSDLKTALPGIQQLKKVVARSET